MHSTTGSFHVLYSSLHHVTKLREVLSRLFVFIFHIGYSDEKYYIYQPILN